MGKGMVQIDVSALETLEKQLKQFPDSGGKMLYKGINSALGSVKTIAFKEIPKVYAISKGDLKAYSEDHKAGIINSHKATAEGAVEFTGKILTLGRFFFYPFSPGIRLPVVTMVKRAGGMKRIKRQAESDGKLKSPFIAPTGAKDKDKIQAIPFVRTGEFKPPTPKQLAKPYNKYKKLIEAIKPLHTVSIPQMMENEKVRPEIERKTGEMVVKRVEKAINKELNRLGANK